MTRRKVLAITAILFVLIATLAVGGIIVRPGKAGKAGVVYSPTAYHVPGQNYEVCSDQSEFLTSPWTYQSPTASLSAATGTAAITSLSVSSYNLTGIMDGGSYVTVTSGATSEVFTTSAQVDAGALTSIPVTSATPTIDFPSGSTVTIGQIIYTAAEYEALTGYGTTLPPLPSYLSTAVVAEPPQAYISQYATAELMYVAGGSYPDQIGAIFVSGDEMIGGSAPGYPEPVGNDGSGQYSNFSDSNNHFNGSDLGGGTLAASVTDATSFTANSGYSAGYQASEVGFPDGTVVSLTSDDDGTITVGSPITESAGTPFWLIAGFQATGVVTSAAAVGATSITATNTTSGGLPYVPYDQLVLGTAEGTSETVLVQSVSGDTLTLMSPLAQAVPENAPVVYGSDADDVTIEYLTVADPTVSGTDAVVQMGYGWTLSHVWLHDAYAGGANSQNTSASGQAIQPVGYDTAEFNCFQRFGEYVWNGGGVDSSFDYNEVEETPYQPDLSGNGQSGCGKWWGSLDNDIIDNTFEDDRHSACIWQDNGNTGTLVEGNYFAQINQRAIQNETGFDSAYIDNLFQDVSYALYLNSSGGWDIPGSRFVSPTTDCAAGDVGCLVSEGKCPSGETGCVLVGGNVFDNVQAAFTIWQSSGRSTLSSGEAINGSGVETGSSDYAADGFPNNAPATGTVSDPVTTNGTFYGSHYADEYTGNPWSVVSAQTCSTETPCGTSSNPLVLSGGSGGSTSSPVLNDWIGFSSEATTSTTDTTDVSTFAGSGTIDATTTGFPASGQLYVATSGASSYAVVSYTATTGSTFTGVNLVRGSGTLSGAISEVQPYQVTAISCPGGNCVNNDEVQTSPTITTDLTAGEGVYNTGTCRYYAPDSSPSGPLDPSGNSYYDDCQWQTRNVTVSGNTFIVDPSQFNATPYPWGGTWESSGNTCTTGSSGNCAQVTTGYQYNNGGPTYQGATEANAMMSVSTLAAPLDNLNASGSPFVGGSTGNTANSEAPYDDVFDDNTYVGDWIFNAYNQAVDCAVSWSGSALEWGTSGTGACYGLSFLQWQDYWGQDAGSTESDS